MDPGCPPLKTGHTLGTGAWVLWGHEALVLGTLVGKQQRPPSLS